MTPDAPLIDSAAFETAAPEVVAALRVISRQAAEAGLDKALVELLKARASQINGCVYCLTLHLDWARKAGVAQAKLDALPVWRESRLYDERERAALAWAEALTRPGDHAAVAASRAGLQPVFETREIVALTVAMAAINAWNRIAGPLGFPPA
jgi:AhpD family alkylhydroperoxidase